ncbi:MAG TPA: 50S ribosomal protein L32 [Chloroflexota bacterium]|jgi:large subunit ribosomal protein L32
MVGLPKKKISSARRGQRRSHDHIVLPPMMDCPQCKQRKPTHLVCPNCGTYNGIDILRLDAKAKQKPE